MSENNKASLRRQTRIFLEKCYRTSTATTAGTTGSVTPRRRLQCLAINVALVRKHNFAVHFCLPEALTGQPPSRWWNPKWHAWLGYTCVNHRRLRLLPAPCTGIPSVRVPVQQIYGR